LHIEFVDPELDKFKAMVMGVRGPWPMLIFQRGERVERLGSDTEQDITNAIIKITRDKKKLLCFSEGLGERDPDNQEQHGIGFLKSELLKAAYETRKIGLLRETAVPSACDVFVVAGPTRDFLPPLVDALRSYVTGGGKLLLMVEPPEKDTTFPNLVGLLREFGIEAGNNIVLDVSPAMGPSPVMPVANRYPHHDITKDMRLATIFATVRSMRAGSTSGEGISAQNLAETEDAAWGETNFDFQKKPEKDAQDLAGPISVAAVSTVRGGPAEGRVVAFGDVDFAANQILVRGPGNRDMVLNSVAWLCQEGDLISVRGGDPEQNRLFLNMGQQWLVRAFSVVLLPSMFLAGGIMSWWRRRG
jgi:ABC-type uncharacterized transport system involved in gliding motility auxiliary subunit